MAADDSRIQRLEWLASGVACAVLAAACILPRDRPLGGIQLCAVKAVSGIPCPSCGITRSLVELGHGDPWSAVRFHPLGPALCALLLLLAVLPVLPASAKRWLHGISRSVTATLAALAVIVVTWAVRLALGTGPP